jgi:hypothetical protein
MILNVSNTLIFTDKGINAIVYSRYTIIVYILLSIAFYYFSSVAFYRLTGHYRITVKA